MTTDIIVCQAIVVGGGPAGSAAAIALARAGYEVILLDKASFPRDKPCGDLLGVRALRLARELGIKEDVLSPYAPLAGAIVTSTGGTLDLAPKRLAGRLMLRGSDARVVPRLVFDAAMVAAATRAGATLRQVTVRSIGSWDGQTRTIDGVTTEGPVRFSAPLVVLAGGYGSSVLLGEHGDERPQADAPQPPKGIARRGYFRGVTTPPDRIAFCLDDWVLPGYGWVFPLPDGSANVGVGTLVRAGEERGGLMVLYRRFIEDPASPAAPWLQDATSNGTSRAWPLDLGPRRRTLVHDGLMLAGEAAGFVGPLTGAGIAFALTSGALAGETGARALAVGETSQQHLLPYHRTVRRRFRLWLQTEAAAQRWLTNPAHVQTLVKRTRPLPPTGTLGAALLLHLG